MASNYWISLFTKETWLESSKNNWSVVGHPANMNNKNNISKGDTFLCYITKQSVFVGALKVTGPHYLVKEGEEDTIWSSNLYPLRYPTQLICKIPILGGVSLREIRAHSRNASSWDRIYRFPGLQIPSDDAQWIMNQLQGRSHDLSGAARSLGLDGA